MSKVQEYVDKNFPLEARKNLKKINEMLENPQITQQQKDKLTRIRNKFLSLIIECVFKKYHLKQEVEVLKKKYE